MKTETFHKQERIVSRKQIETLFSGGTSQSLSAFPLRVVFMTQALSPGEAPVQILISVPKKHFKHAVDRNRVRRLTRECWRKRKEPFYDNLRERDCSIVLSLVYIHNEIMPYAQLEHKMDKLLTALQQDIDASRS